MTEKINKNLNAL